jgi:endonuclease/exonuclease/phosphatase family metal-dependent hydrolase
MRSGSRIGVSLRVALAMLQAALVVLAGASAALAQTTVTLDQSKTEAWYGTVRGGTYANTNINDLLETRKSTDLTYHRNAMLKFDTHNFVPQGTNITSAKLTMTVIYSSADATRRIGVYPVTQSWDENQMTWNIRRTGLAWKTKGGDFGQKITEQVVGPAGTTVTFDITSYVRQIVMSSASTRYTRVALVDLDGSTKESYRSYATSDDPNPSMRPTLVITYGAAPPVQQPSGPAEPEEPQEPALPQDPGTGGPATTLRVLHYNIGKNGWGTDGRYDPNRVANWVAQMDPDVISFNEIERWNSYSNYADGIALYKAMLEQRTGHTWYTWGVQAYGNWDQKGLISAIFSKIPFSATYRTVFSAGKLKSAGGVTITVNGRNINVVTTHFDPYTESYRTTQGRELASYAAGLTDNRIVGGDFNDQPGDASITAMTAAHYDGWAEAKKQGIAYSAPDNPYGNTKNTRIDYIFYAKNAPNLTLKKITVVDTRDANGVMPSDHRPVLAEFLVD